MIGAEVPLSNPVFPVPNWQSAVEAAIARVNLSGGLNGHPLKFDFCDSRLAAAQELSCARKLVADHVVAVVDANPAVAKCRPDMAKHARHRRVSPSDPQRGRAAVHVTIR